MSKSKEGIDRNRTAGDPNSEADAQQRSSDEFNQQVGARGQTDYTAGRESSRDFPRRSTSLRYRNEFDRQRVDNPERSNLYSRQNRADYNQQNRFQNRGLQREDRGDFSSRGSEYERNQTRGERWQNQTRSNFEPDRRYDDPYRRYEGGGQGDSAQAPDWQQNQQGYGNQRNQQRYGRPATTRDFGTPNYGSPEFDQQTDRPQKARSQSYNPRTDNPDRQQWEERGSNRQGGDRFRQEYGGSNRATQYDTAYDDRGFPVGVPSPYYDANTLEYNWQGWPARTHEGYRYVVRCRDVMTKDVTFCSPNATIRAVAEQMEDDNVGSIPVVENGRLIGIVTDRDIVCRVLAEGKDSRQTAAKEAMTDDIVTCTPDESIMEAIRKMGEYQIRRIPICDPNGRLRGILSLGDIALEAEHDRDIACALERISEPTPYQAHRR